MNNEETDHQEETELIEVVSEALPPNARWQPVIGEETLQLLEKVHLSDDVKRILRNEAISVLSKCVPPTATRGQETGLVVGYIQSGKTMSFTTVAAIARDNQYPLVVVIAGTSKSLIAQSERRLRRDLGIDEGERTWRLITNPRIDSSDHTSISAILDDWRDGSVPPEERRTVLLVVMKNHIHLDHLIDVLDQVDLEGLPVLIIDDEADQAGLNNLVSQGNESTTYQKLRVLKQFIPHHTFLQYTATPQGPLLINLIDVLSPEFAATLTPGPGYVGGAEFFLEGTPYIREIPPGDIQSRQNPLTEPPQSLLSALRIFFLGVASGLERTHGRRGNRSMMIHPTQRTGGHELYFRWVMEIRSAWMQILQNPADPDYEDLLNDFRNDYQELRHTVADLESFEILTGRLLYAIRRTEPHLINALTGTTPQVDWSSAYSHILVGGQVLDRGFTVEGLTVTYMPRGVGARRVDTIQQRGRFFGYKRDYLGFCRVYLEQAVAIAFRRYVEHEEDVRHRLEEFFESGEPLSELRRVFLLSRMMSPTRDSVIDIDFVRATFNEGWFYPRAPHDSDEATENNRLVVREFLDELTMLPNQGHPDRTLIQRHMEAEGISLSNMYESLLSRLRFSRLSDAQNFLGALVIIERHLRDNPDATCSLFQMSSGHARLRRLNDYSEIPNLFQGAAPVNPPERRGEIYPGDRVIRGGAGITVQIHTLNIEDNTAGTRLFENVPNIAIWIPENIAGDVVIQDQGNLTVFEDE